ncbi:MAG: glutamate synthase-related protein [bacterium]|nr:glutamate synthase-related protein [bacterium]
MSSDCTPTDPFPLHPEDTRERDACALICAVRKGGQATHGNVKRTVEALTRMGHRTGIVDGEGDGVGVMTDIPRQLWTKILGQRNLRSSLASDPNFWVAHLMIPAALREQAASIVDHICRTIMSDGLDLLYEDAGKVDRHALGRSARQNEPLFWQFAGMNGRVPGDRLEGVLYNIQRRMEREHGVHFPSFSSRSVVYKVQGTVEILQRYYPELRDPDYTSTVTLGHARYSTNTNPIFERAQPFNVLGHNGEFNTISRFRLEAEQLGIALHPGNSDSQDVDALIDALCMEHNLTLIEAMEYVFPPFEHDLMQNAPEIHALYDQVRQAFGPFAQGPAAVAARVGDQVVFSVDALGLRPLWFGETEKEIFATSERGVYQLDAMTVDPRPLAPGEKIAVLIKPGRAIEVLDYPAIQRYMLSRSGFSRGSAAAGSAWPMAAYGLNNLSAYPGVGAGGGGAVDAHNTPALTLPDAEATPLAPRYTWAENAAPLNTITLGALGWERYHVNVIETMAETTKEQVGALGWDGPLGAISHTRVNLADYFKETVAVVTNPAIDRERERAQFSAQVLLGVRPGVNNPITPDEQLIKLEMPLLLGGHPALGSEAELRSAAAKLGTLTLDQVVERFGERALVIPMTAAPDEGLENALSRVQQDAINAVTEGYQLLILDDAGALRGDALWIDPLLVTAAVDTALRRAGAAANLRRRTGIVVRSGALRDLHDVAMCLGLGANALVPYALYAVGLGIAPKAPREALTSDQVIQRTLNTANTLVGGLQKVTSTMGCHELRGYGLAFSSVGLSSGIAAVFGTPNYFGSGERGTTWDDLQAEAQTRAAELRGEKAVKLDNPDRFYPKMWKKIEDLALGDMTLDEYESEMLVLEREMPVAPRHLIGLKTVDSDIAPEDVDLTIGRHDLPVLIGAMSFGSQGELAYKAYGEAAYHLNIICVNGEGGELPEVMGRYPHHRGNQIASARFGVNIGFLNSCDYLEIKIGQGAKPGEGGQLPGYKVTEQVALARSTPVGVDLISPSNNHDLYSIEDLAQLIDELKTANPRAKVSVKIPVVPGVGIIAVGIAKAGADIINITGYEGGTGAARAHSLRHVGLPAEIGVWLAHHALTESGLRDQVEIWCDGGMKSGRDVLKMMCLGANRVGFGTVAMVAVGCTICRKCHEGTCHVGITTHIKTREEALEKGIKHFDPRDYEASVHGIVNVFHVLAEDIRRWTAAMGFNRVQDLVGRADLLEQLDMHQRIDLRPLFVTAQERTRRTMQPGVGRMLARPRNTLSKQITALMSEHTANGDQELTYVDEHVMAMDRALGTHLNGAIRRGEVPNAQDVTAIHLHFSSSAIPGNGLAAFLDAPLEVMVEGGAQDGVAKCAKGGTLAILKGLNHDGKRLDGSVGKSFAYGAQGGRFIVQGNADSRACIRLSGADVIFGGQVTEPLRDELGGLGARANLKGYACEYMTSGRVIILGDPGPWMCAGMSGGVIYQRIQPEMNLTVEAIRRRIAKGAVVDLFPLDETGLTDIRELLSAYFDTLVQHNQAAEVSRLFGLLERPQDHFVKIAAPPRSH